MVWSMFDFVDALDVLKLIQNLDSIPFFIVASYLSFILRIGPNIMRNRKPYRLSRIIALYNIIQIIFNAYIGYEIVTYLANNFKLNELHCILEEKPGTPTYRNVKEIQLLCILSKFTDLFDTIFFVLRKKQASISFLHVYHHLMVFLSAWFMFIYLDGGCILLFGAINCFVHVTMYLYYLLCLSPSLIKLAQYMKKPLTQAQIAQFIVVGLQGILFFLDGDCEAHNSVQYYFGMFGLTQVVMMLVLFGNFYRRTYVPSSYGKCVNAPPSKTQ